MSWEVSERKIRAYLLNINHRVGGPKARFFLARGFAEGAWQVLDEALRRHPVDNPIESEEQTNYGLKVVVRCQIQTPDGRLSSPSRESSAPRIDPSKSFC